MQMWPKFPESPQPEDLPFEPDPVAAFAWRTALARHFEREAIVRPLPDRRSFTPEQEFQCRVLGGALLQWGRYVPDHWLAERDFLSRDFKVDPDPVIIFVSSVPGLVAAREIHDPRPEYFVYLSAESYEEFIAQHPDHTFRWHVRYISQISTSLENGDAVQAAAEYPLAAGECYWLHREETDLAILFGRYYSHLWKFDGGNVTLLEGVFRQAIS